MIWPLVNSFHFSHIQYFSHTEPLKCLECIHLLTTCPPLPGLCLILNFLYCQHSLHVVNNVLNMFLTISHINLKFINNDNHGFSILKSLYWFTFWFAELWNLVKKKFKKGPVSYIVVCLKMIWHKDFLHACKNNSAD